jgi:hypothetical protein
MSLTLKGETSVTAKVTYMGKPHGLMMLDNPDVSPSNNIWCFGELKWSDQASSLEQRLKECCLGGSKTKRDVKIPLDFP